MEWSSVVIGAIGSAVVLVITNLVTQWIKALRAGQKVRKDDAMTGLAVAEKQMELRHIEHEFMTKPLREIMADLHKNYERLNARFETIYELHQKCLQEQTLANDERAAMKASIAVLENKVRGLSRGK